MITRPWKILNAVAGNNPYEQPSNEISLHPNTHPTIIIHVFPIPIHAHPLSRDSLNSTLIGHHRISQDYKALEDLSKIIKGILFIYLPNP